MGQNFSKKLDKKNCQKNYIKVVTCKIVLNIFKYIICECPKRTKFFLNCIKSACMIFYDKMTRYLQEFRTLNTEKSRPTTLKLYPQYTHYSVTMGFISFFSSSDMQKLNHLLDVMLLALILHLSSFYVLGIFKIYHAKPKN